MSAGFQQMVFRGSPYSRIGYIFNMIDGVLGNCEDPVKLVNPSYPKHCRVTGHTKRGLGVVARFPKAAFERCRTCCIIECPTDGKNFHLENDRCQWQHGRDTTRI